MIPIEKVDDMVLEVIRAILGFLLVMFIPGHALTWAFFPDDKEIDWLERIALSVGLSISSVVLAVYVSNVVLGFKINLINSLLIITLITLVGASIGYVRRQSEEAKEEESKPQEKQGGALKHAKAKQNAKKSIRKRR